MSIFDIMKQAGKELGKPWPAYAWPGGYDMFYIMDDGGTLAIPNPNSENYYNMFPDSLVDWVIAYGDEFVHEMIMNREYD